MYTVQDMERKVNWNRFEIHWNKCTDISKGITAILFCHHVILTTIPWVYGNYLIKNTEVLLHFNHNSDVL